MTVVYFGRGALDFSDGPDLRDLSLELMSFDVGPTANLYTNDRASPYRRAVGANQGKDAKNPSLRAA